jgi:hypothetical protein
VHEEHNLKADTVHFNFLILKLRKGIVSIEGEFNMKLFTSKDGSLPLLWLSRDPTNERTGGYSII